MAQTKCAHHACGCAAAGGDQYCSDRCRTLSTQTPEQMNRCDCGHPGCRSSG